MWDQIDEVVDTPTATDVAAVAEANDGTTTPLGPWVFDADNPDLIHAGMPFDLQPAIDLHNPPIPIEVPPPDAPAATPTGGNESATAEAPTPAAPTETAQAGPPSTALPAAETPATTAATPSAVDPADHHRRRTTRTTEHAARLGRRRHGAGTHSRARARPGRRCTGRPARRRRGDPARRSARRHP